MITILRRIGESVSIGDDVKLVVVSVKGNEVRVAIDAPKSVRVERVSKEDARIGLASRRAADATDDDEAPVEEVDPGKEAATLLRVA